MATARKPLMIGIAAVFALIVIGVAALVFWLFMPSRKVVASTPLPCGVTPLELRSVVESPGHTPLHFDQTLWEVGAPGETSASDVVQSSLLPPMTLIDAAELPPLANSRRAVVDEVAWNIYTTDAARFACLSANLPVLERTLGLPSAPGTMGVASSAPVFVWHGTREAVWPVFRATDGDVTLTIRVRRSGRVEAEFSQRELMTSFTIAVLHRLESGRRALTVSNDPISAAPIAPPPSMRGGAAALLARARDSGGHTLAERLPYVLQPSTDGERLRLMLPNVPLETY